MKSDLLNFYHNNYQIHKIDKRFLTSELTPCVPRAHPIMYYYANALGFSVSSITL